MLSKMGVKVKRSKGKQSLKGRVKSEEGKQEEFE
jgi:hypothetical protein